MSAAFSARIAARLAASLSAKLVVEDGVGTCGLRPYAFSGVRAAIALWRDTSRTGDGMRFRTPGEPM